jgi:hypothetical protein
MEEFDIRWVSEGIKFIFFMILQILTNKMFDWWGEKSKIKKKSCQLLAVSYQVRE